MRKLLYMVLVGFGMLHAQQYWNPNDERFKSLYLEKAQNDYKLQKLEHQRQIQLHQKKLISDREFQEAEAQFNNALITFQQAILSLAFEQPHITIDRGVKYQARDGKKRVKLTLRNTTGGLVEGRKITLEDFEDIRTDQVANVYVSLINDDNAIVSMPYEAKINILPFNQPVTVDFVLLQDLDNVRVSMVYGDKKEEKKIFLQKDQSANRVLMTCEQFSQETDLGSQADYQLKLELFSNADNIYKLEALNLPTQLSCDFYETGGVTRLSQVKFSQEINNRSLTLSVHLPDRYDSSAFVIDRSLVFYAAAIPAAALEKLEQQKQCRADDLERLNVGYVRLELVPRGVGKIQVRAVNFYQEIRPDEKMNMMLTIVNEGTRRLDNIKVGCQVPVRWLAEVAPDLIPILMPGKETQVNVSINPADDVNIGDYEATLTTESYADNRKVADEDKKIRIHVTGRANTVGILLLILLLLGVLCGIVWFGLKLSKR